MSTLDAPIQRLNHCACCAGEYVPASARALRFGRDAYTAADVPAIAREQLAAEGVALAQTAHIVVADTDLTVIQVWWEEKYGALDPWLADALACPLSASGGMVVACPGTTLGNRDPSASKPRGTMAYYFKPDESVQDAIIRIAREQIGKAIDEVEDADLDRHETVHQVRKRCKKVRGLIRAVRPALGKTYKRENARFRDAARSLSYARDAQSQLESLDDLTRHFEDQLEPSFASGVRDRLVDRRRRVADDEVGLDERLDEFLATMQASYHRVGGWKLAEAGFPAVAGGLQKTYKRGCKAMGRAYEKPSAERFHEWRKRTKYHWYHLRLLRPVWKPVVKKLCSGADDLSDLLGDEHDLAVLRDTLVTEPGAFGDATELEALLGLLGRRRLELQQEARLLGARVFAETADALVDRFGTYWAAWETGQGIEPGITPQAAAG